MTRLFRGVIWLAVAAPLFSGCGLGTAGIAAGANSGGGSGSPPPLEAFAVENPKVSPCMLRLDASQPVRVGLFYDTGAGEQPMMHLVGLAGNEVDLPANEISVEWDFESELSTTTFVPGVRLVARSGSGALSGGVLTLGMGNDAPEVLSIDQIDIDPKTNEASGTTGIEFTVADSSDDVVSVKVEFDLQGDDPDAGWQLARPALIDPGDQTPEFGITDVQVSDLGTTLTFFWDTDADTDLKDLEREVRIRCSATDGFLTGAPLVSEMFRVDNNAEPIVQLQHDAVIANPDERRGIPVPFLVIDEEEDSVEVILQWRREGEGFPLLLESELDAVLADPMRRREKQICTPYHIYARGRVVPIDETSVRLPELALGESWILASGLEGRELELLRPSSKLELITPSWDESPLVGPIAALPVGDGLTAIVLDMAGKARVREIELATGAVVRELATLGPGVPSAMGLERGGEAVLVATDLAGVWRLERVELLGGKTAELVVSGGADVGPVRGLASLGTNALVFTVGSALLFLDYRDAQAPVLSTLLAGLATPWGVVADAENLYVAEREAITTAGTGRVLAVELDSRGMVPVVVRTEDLQRAQLDRPSALALEHGGSRLLIATGGGAQLVGLDLGAQGRNVAFPIGQPTAGEIASIAAGPDDLRCAAIPSGDELLIGGGLEQRRTVVAYERAETLAHLDEPFRPEPGPDRRWRVSGDLERLPASSAGRQATFVWNSAEDIGGGPAFLRAVARDDELGVMTEAVAPKPVRGALDVTPIVLGGQGLTRNPTFVTTADLDGDGDQDLLTANSDGHDVTILFQTSAGSFDPTPHVAGTGSGVRSVAVADLDGDGDQDLAFANRVGDHLAVHLQTSPGTFAPSQILDGLGMVRFPRSVAAADLDGDGDQDLVSANELLNNLTVFFQSSPGSFDPTPRVLSTLSTNLHVTVADLDGDGDKDIASAGGQVAVFFQNARGAFAPPLVVAQGDVSTQYFTCVTAADLDGDGDQDIATANFGSASVWVHFQRAPGSFDAVPLVLGSSAFLLAERFLTAADLDGDGDQDLASTANLSASLTVFLQRSPGSFSPEPLPLGLPETTGIAWCVTAADLDGDGHQDLATTGYLPEDGPSLGFATVLLQDTPAGFSPLPLVLGETTAGLVTSAAAADLDADGDRDLAMTDTGINNLKVFLQRLPGSFHPTPVVLGGPGITDSPNSVVTADLDGDGDQDLVSANGGNSVSTGGLTVFFQTEPSFDPEPLVLGASATGHSFVAAADLDEDGDQDLASVIVNETSGTLAVFFQKSPGTFSSSPLELGGSGITDSPNQLVAADLDTDGDMDLACANGGGGNLTVFFQESGSFGPDPLVLGGPGVTDGAFLLAAADLDGDGDQDLVSANFVSFTSPSTLTIFFQTSPGNFGQMPLVLDYTGSIFRQGLIAPDLDADGDNDLVVTGNPLQVFLQGSPGRFGPVDYFSTPQDAYGLAAADLDGDGDQDLITTRSDLRVFWGGR